MYKNHDYITNYISPGTVLVAHNGFVYDFPVSLAEIERRPNCLTQQKISECTRFPKTVHVNKACTDPGSVQCTSIVYICTLEVSKCAQN